MTVTLGKIMLETEINMKKILRNIFIFSFPVVFWGWLVFGPVFAIYHTWHSWKYQTVNIYGFGTRECFLKNN